MQHTPPCPLLCTSDITLVTSGETKDPSQLSRSGAVHRTGTPANSSPEGSSILKFGAWGLQTILRVPALPEQKHNGAAERIRLRHVAPQPKAAGRISGDLGVWPGICPELIPINHNNTMF